MKTIHIILNSHIDPVWLWPWQSGVDAALATCRSACDRLDAHRDLYFNRGEAWVYQQVELLDPKLFKRIRKHVESGRWAIVGGWWIQPDCNLPSGWAMRKQIELGRKYFTKTFKRFPKTAYNVDSFGHSAALPGLMREFDQTRYVMMRPQDHELALPARLFRWRGYDNGPEVTTFRIANAYTTWNAEIAEHVLASTIGLPDGVEHTMCFVGVGDHGGGPTEAQIAYLNEHRDAFDGWRLEFSTVDRFFDAVAHHHNHLPLFTGELQHHAVGCYTTNRPVKTAVRRAEHLLAQAEAIIHGGVRPRAGTAALMDTAWRDVCFSHFHDILGGTCVPSAYRQVLDQLGRASAIADELVQHTFRRKLAKLKPHPVQRLAICNASDHLFDGYLTVSPWLEGHMITEQARLFDENDRTIDYQVVSGESLVQGPRQGAILLREPFDSMETRLFFIDPLGAVPPRSKPNDVRVDGFALRSSDIACGDSLEFPVGKLAMPHLETLDDLSDTWGHGVSRYNDSPASVAKFNAPVIVARGPLMASKILDGQIGVSRVRAEWRVYRDDPFVELRVMVIYAARHKMLKLVLPLPAPAHQRIDGIMDGSLQRSNDGIERPLRDWTRIDCSNGRQIGIIAPDCFALDCNTTSVRLSLVRSPLMAHHIPHKPVPWQGLFSDQGRHEFRFWFCYDDAIDELELERRAMNIQRPPIVADLTLGMGKTTPKRLASAPQRSAR
ncbi:MAG: hypothetical protein JO353_10980 [Phycisphaerae bacterium]|nr:hypothetical protein [Phycisphaerae bacterium]